MGPTSWPAATAIHSSKSVRQVWGRPTEVLPCENCVTLLTVPPEMVGQAVSRLLVLVGTTGQRYCS